MWVIGMGALFVLGAAIYIKPKKSKDFKLHHFNFDQAKSKEFNQRD